MPSLLDRQLKTLKFDSYEAYLKSPRWLAFRSQYQQAGLPKRCIACSYPKYRLHHVTYRRLGAEELGDVVPLCDRCHRDVHRFHDKHKVPLLLVDHAIQAIFQINAEQCQRKLAQLPHFCKRRKIERDWKYVDQLRKEKKERKKKEKELVESPRDSCDFYKISRDLKNFTRCLDAGYQIVELAEMYNVSVGYVRGYMRKFAHLFEGSPQLEELLAGGKRKKKKDMKMVDATVADLWNVGRAEQ